MTWLTPTIAALAAAVAVPTLLILYFLKLRRRDVEISSTLLWKKAIQDMQANAPFQRLRRNILLLLQLLALAAALVGLAQPQLLGDTLTGARHVIMVDRSASMSALDERAADGSPVTRLDKAKQDALRLVDALREPNLLDRTRGMRGDEAMVIVFDTSAKALQAFTSDKALLRAAIEAIEPTDAPTSVDEAFRLARAQAPRRFRRDDRPGAETVSELPAGPVGTIHLFTDGRLPDLAKAELSPEDVVVYHALGTPEAPNIAITSLRAERAFDNPGRLSIFVGLQSTEPRPRTVDVELRLDGQPAAIKPVALDAATAPGATTAPAEGSPPAPGAPPAAAVVPALGGAVFTLDRPQGAIVTVAARAPDTDVFRGDNTAWVVAPPSKALAVAIVTRGNTLFRTALEPLPLARLDQLTPEQFEVHRQRAAAGQAAPYDVVILDGYLPEASGPPAATPPPAPGAPPRPTSTAADRPPLPPGQWLIFNAVPPGAQGLDDRGEAPPTALIDWSRDHPALRGLTLDALVIAKSRRVEIPAGAAARVVARADTGPAIVELTSGTSRALVVPFDVLDTSWPFDLSFVLFLAQAVEFLGDDQLASAASVQPGGVLSDRVPPAATDLRVQLPTGEREPMGTPAPDGRVVFGPVLRTGVYQMSWTGPAGPTDATVQGRVVRPFTANLLDARESDLGARPTVELPTAVAAAAEDDTIRAPQPLWPWLLLAMLALLMLEWFVYNRRVHL